METLKIFLFSVSAESTHSVDSTLAANQKQKGVSAVLLSILVFIVSHSHCNILHAHHISHVFLILCSITLRFKPAAPDSVCNGYDSQLLYDVYENENYISRYLVQHFNRNCRTSLATSAESASASYKLKG